MGKEPLPLIDIVRDTLRQIDECFDPRKNEPIALSLRDYLERKIIELGDSAGPDSADFGPALPSFPS